MQHFTNSPEETKKLAHHFAKNLKKGDIVAFTGDLGAGKTTFTQEVGKYFGVERMVSPTFIIMRKYKNNLYHLDLYRLENNLKEELENLGFFDIIKNEENIVLIEWADKIKNLLPKKTIWVNFKILEGDIREIIY